MGDQCGNFKLRRNLRRFPDDLLLGGGQDADRIIQKKEEEAVQLEERIHQMMSATKELEDR